MTGMATARAHPNIAFIKYWGNADDALRIPVNSSISMNLAGLYAETQVTWGIDSPGDQLMLNGTERHGAELERVVRHLDILRRRLALDGRARVVSTNNFPTGAGVASSAAAFAALTKAGIAAAGVQIGEREQSTLARRGSGSAARSIPGGFVEWYAGSTDADSYAETVAAPDHWELVDVVAVVSTSHKAVGSTAGHPSASSSDLQKARVAGATNRLNVVRSAIHERNFVPFAETVEYDSNLMHAVMMTSRPPLFYWLPPTLTLMQAVRGWREEGLQVCYTLDAGPNVHCICVRKDAEAVSARLRGLSEVVNVLVAEVGGPAFVVDGTVEG